MRTQRRARGVLLIFRNVLDYLRADEERVASMSENPKLHLPLGYRMNRRSVLRVAGLATAGLAGASLLAACADDDDDTTEDVGAEPDDDEEEEVEEEEEEEEPEDDDGEVDDAEDMTVDVSQWSPEYINEIAGTMDVDTAAFCASVVPLDYEGSVTFSYIGPTEASPQITWDFDEEFWEAWNETYPGIPLAVGDGVQSHTYGDMLDQVRTAAFGNAAPNVARLPILWGVEFAARGMLEEIDLADFGFSEEDFWPGALQSCMWEGRLYGIPTNNETMALIWNKNLFEEAGLDPESPPATWDDVVEYSRIISEETGAHGFGMVARVNHGNTPFRFMPTLWAYGGSALDEAEDNPQYQESLLRSDGAKAALQAYYDMYVRDQSVPTGALTNDNTANTDLFIGGQLGMYIGHPSEYAAMVDRAANATGAEQELAQAVVDSIGYGLIPEGPARRAVVFGGSNVHIFKDEFSDHDLDWDAARALIAFQCAPEWSIKMAWAGSNPGHLGGFRTHYMQQRLDEINFLDVTSSMLPYGIPFPVIPEATEIMNITIPELLQNVLTEQMSVDDAAERAADEVESIVQGREGY
jgi:multiple sugar transport system substrate-binding protein